MNMEPELLRQLGDWNALLTVLMPLGRWVMSFLRRRPAGTERTSKQKDALAKWVIESPKTSRKLKRAAERHIDEALSPDDD